METIKDRIKICRKQLNLSQKSFGEKLGVSRDVIKNIELNLVDTKEHFIKLICLEFGVNEEWLRTGTGEMFSRNHNDVDGSLAYAMGKLAACENEDVKKALLLLTELDDEQLIQIGNLVKSLKGSAN